MKIVTRTPSRRPRRLCAVAVTLALTAALAACGSSSSSTSASGASGRLTTVRMVEEWPVADGFWIPWIVAKAQGYYKAAGINLDIIPPPNTSATAEYIGTGRADVAFDTTVDVLFARAQGVPMVSIASYGSGNNWGLISSHDTPLNFADVKGKTIGTYSDSWSKAQLQIMLHSEGLTLNDVHLVTAANDTVPLLLKKKVDAITGVTNAEGSELASEGQANYSDVLAKDHGVPNAPVWVLAANSKWLAKNPALAKSFMAATLKGWQYAIDNPKIAVADFEKAYPKAESLAYATLQWKDTMTLFGSTVSASSVSQTDATWSSLLAAAKQYKLANKIEAPSDYYTNSALGQ
jgi:putative hydroxymethylpyrimidine transport system substrate-binding protein